MKVRGLVFKSISSFLRCGVTLPKLKAAVLLSLVPDFKAELLEVWGLVFKSISCSAEIDIESVNPTMSICRICLSGSEAGSYSRLIDLCINQF